MKLKLKDVEETALIPLSNRASETRRKNPRICDPKAVEIVDYLELSLKKYDKTVTHECVIARTIMLDRSVKEFIEKYDDALCINIGCGLDDRFTRLDNGKIRWLDVDLPNIIRTRKKVFSDTERRKMLEGNILKEDWTEEVKSAFDIENPQILLVAEGIFMYLTKEEYEKILKIITGEFKSGRLLVELIKPCMMKEKRHQTVKKTNAKFGWGTNTGSELEILEPGIQLLVQNRNSFCFGQSEKDEKLWHRKADSSL